MILENVSKLLRGITIGEFTYEDRYEPIRDILEDLGDTMDINSYYISNGKPFYDCVEEIMNKLTYDNGKPLGMKYFDFYDRDQAYNTLMDDFEIELIELKNIGEIKIYLDLSFEELYDYLNNLYGGSSYDHDYND